MQLNQIDDIAPSARTFPLMMWTAFMIEHDTHRHLEVTDGERAVASADIHAPTDHSTPVHAVLHAASGHIRPGSRSELVDAVLDLPEVQDRDRLTATVPLGDAESLQRLQHRCEHVTSRAAGSSALIEAEVPHSGPTQGRQTHAESAAAEGR